MFQHRSDIIETDQEGAAAAAKDHLVVAGSYLLWFPCSLAWFTLISQTSWIWTPSMDFLEGQKLAFIEFGACLVSLVVGAVFRAVVDRYEVVLNLNKVFFGPVAVILHSCALVGDFQMHEGTVI